MTECDQTFSSESDGAQSNSARWPQILCGCFCVYYILSFVTLPFVNKIWIGEWPVLATFQGPKSVLKSAIHQPMIAIMRWLGLSYGSHSPDYIATHNWALLAAMVIPVVLVVGICSMSRSTTRFRLLGVFLLCALLDAAVTFWFDSTSNLKLFNAVYF